MVQESLSTLKMLRQRLPTSRSRSFFSMSSGVLGYGLPAAVGVALAERDKGGDRKIVCIVGDGAANYVIRPSGRLHSTSCRSCSSSLATAPTIF